MVKKNDRIKLTITDMSIRGEGIGKYYPEEESSGGPGMTFFVKNAVIGDQVLAVVTLVKKGYGYAKMLELLRPSPDRVRPLCPLAERCGGCQIMQLSYQAQLAFKENKVRNDLERIGGQHCREFYPIIPMETFPGDSQPAHFRNKMQFPVGWDREGHVITGFYAGHTHYVIAAPDCPASPAVNKGVLQTVRMFLEKRRISTYNEEKGKGLVRHVLIRNGVHTGQIMVCLVLNGEFSPEMEQELVEELLMHQPEEPWRIASICLNYNRERTNVILGREVKCLYGTPYIEEQIRGSREGVRPLTFRIHPLSFFQTNTVQTARLYDTALKFADLKGTETVWDLYCGTGTISLFLARKAAYVRGVEIIPEAIENARENAQINGISNVSFTCGRSEEIFPEAVRNGEGKESSPDLVVLDPPRKGCDPVLLEAIRRTGPERIVYVSCDPATLARDVKMLCAPADGQNNEYSYELKKVQPADMFPHTMHVETVCLMSKKSDRRQDYYDH